MIINSVTFYSRGCFYLDDQYGYSVIALQSVVIICLHGLLFFFIKQELRSCFIQYLSLGAHHLLSSHHMFTYLTTSVVVRLLKRSRIVNSLVN